MDSTDLNHVPLPMAVPHAVRAYARMKDSAFAVFYVESDAFKMGYWITDTFTEPPRAHVNYTHAQLAEWLESTVPAIQQAFTEVSAHNATHKHKVYARLSRMNGVLQFSISEVQFSLMGECLSEKALSEMLNHNITLKD